MSAPAGVVIAGGGLAAQKCAETLRSRGYDGPVRMVCAEPVRPYDRPPLSKEAIVSTVDPSLRPASWYSDNDVDLLLGTTRDGRRRPLSSRPRAGALRFDQLLIATGAEPRRLPFGSVLRTAADAAELRAALRPGSRLAVVGAGFVGMEVAASARSLGVDVVLIDVMPAPLAGLLGPDVSRWLVGLHRDHGVEVILGEGVAAARRGGLELVSGRRVACDHVLVGIGVDARPVVAGRPARRLPRRRRDRHPALGGRGPPGQAAARAMLGHEAPPPAAPSFWSDQYGLRIQYVGDASGADSVDVGRRARAPATSPPSTRGPAGRSPRSPSTARASFRGCAARHRQPGGPVMSHVPQIDEGVCLAHGDCAVVAPDVFRVDEVAEVIGTGTAGHAAGRRGGLPGGGDHDRRHRHRRPDLPITDRGRRTADCGA